MVKIALDAGHGINTAGKRTPDGEREWSFNNKVLLACQAELNTFENVQILRLDDPTGQRDVPLRERTNKANNWKADVLVSIHHNALAGKWGSHGGTETITNDRVGANPKSVEIAKAVHPGVVKSMGLRDRGLKKQNLHMLRESNMPAILTEGGFMDSTTDIESLRSDAKLKAQGYAIAQNLAKYYNLYKKPVNETHPNQKGVATVKIEGLNLRKGPGVNHEFIRKLKKGEGYKVWAEKDGWLNLGGDQWASWQNGVYMDWVR